MLLLVLTLFSKLSPDQTQMPEGREFLLQEFSKDMQMIREPKGIPARIPYNHKLVP